MRDENPARPVGYRSGTDAGDPSSVGLARRSDALWLGGAVALLGASGYVFLTTTAALVPAADYAALASLYLLVAFLNPGLFLAVEQETTRLVSRWQAMGLGTRDLLVQIGQLTAAMLAGTAVLMLAAEPVLVGEVFNGHIALWVALVICVAAYASGSVTRGIFAGRRRVRAWRVSSVSYRASRWRPRESPVSCRIPSSSRRERCARAR
jgi:O-antigen/teichoic acid export membrane protein